MKQEKNSTFETMVRPILVLTIICIVVSGLLAVTHSITQPIIDGRAQREADASRIVLLPTADSFSKVEYSDDIISDVYAADNGAGYVITGAAKGYGGDVPVTVGINSDGTISAIQIGDNNETPGVGKKVMDASFTDQFKGKTKSSEVDGISGATFSSKAVFAVVDAAEAAYQTVKGA